MNGVPCLWLWYQLRDPSKSAQKLFRPQMLPRTKVCGLVYPVDLLGLPSKKRMLLVYDFSSFKAYATFFEEKVSFDVCNLDSRISLKERALRLLVGRETEDCCENYTCDCNDLPDPVSSWPQSRDCSVLLCAGGPFLGHQESGLCTSHVSHQSSTVRSQESPAHKLSVTLCCCLTPGIEQYHLILSNTVKLQLLSW